GTACASIPEGKTLDLKPFMSKDAFLHSFDGDEDDQDECTPTVDREELLREVDNVRDFAGICLADENVLDAVLNELDYVHGPFKKVHEDVHKFPIAAYKDQNVIAGNGMSGGELGRFPARERKDKSLEVSFVNVAAREIKNVNENYFGAYSSFGSHREMISEMVRTNSYKAAILNNPSLMSHAIVLDVGCGTRILSLFAAQAGAILPDMATMFATGVGRGGTSVPFWENVYGFDMSIIGKEVPEDATQLPIVDVVDSSDIVTGTSVLKTVDLVTMESSNVDFTSSIELEPKIAGSRECYGIVLRFETAFTSRFGKAMPVVLSTFPYKSKTHWSMMILTFKEPIAISSARFIADKA
ncbi:probable protein arginine N-methyltransferase 3, partial [Aristolochia californica]|uniref:probable protein arginine N-methyltransferase 3 n=1 Tax=Aristolochia californica TaxID=171875 RepID=UPI0035DBAD57